MRSPVAACGPGPGRYNGMFYTGEACSAGLHRGNSIRGIGNVVVSACMPPLIDGADRVGLGRGDGEGLCDGLGPGAGGCEGDRHTAACVC